ncbi:hypothetical protein MVES1_001458 [Malassezia vespertilionis]|uniref:uncharacterized protein n=1 Tax=Malassezia vespertilionis TaxID=2020962 RepID=UPI0024B229FE|nr:uncharacterized protein MVES1_001458 [Malassezia vespertilionis]WFD06117.1 hypothetical protein MVES1_001458 [Malassezia vespertilionis]
MSGFGQGGIYQPDAQQQLLQLLQQQQQQQQQPPQTMAFAKPQTDFMNNFTQQQSPTLLAQSNAPMQQGIQNQFVQANVMQQPNLLTPPMNTMSISNPGVAKPQSQDANAVLATMLNKAKSGMLSQNQLAQLRAIVEQQTSQQAQPSQQAQAQAQTNAPTAQYNALLQSLQNAQSLAQQPLMMQSQAGLQQNMMNLGNPDAIKQQPNMVQGVQFVHTIQQRIRDVEQKLTTPMSENERQSLQRAHQELARIQNALVQKLSQAAGLHPSGNVVQPPAPTANSLGNMSFTNTQQNPSMGLQSGISAMHSSPTLGASSVQPMAMPPAQQNVPVPQATISPEQFKRVLNDLMRRHEKPFLGNPILDGRAVDLYRLFITVQALGGSKSVTQKGAWPSIAVSLGLVTPQSPQLQVSAQKVAHIYRSSLELVEEVWSRAMLHQMSLSMNRGTVGNDSQNLSKQFAMPQNQQSFVPAQQVRNSQRHSQHIPPEQLSLLMQQEQRKQQLAKNGHGAQMPNQADKQPWQMMQTLPECGSTPTNPAVKASHNPKLMQGMNNPRIKVTPQMLENAEQMLRKVDASLAALRPRLPVIQNMSEQERDEVLEQSRKLGSLKATVTALLPAFLAMTGNIEPVKRVKIMTYMIDDQLALLPKKQVILRLPDLEKLKVQLTRCIGFVRVNDDKLAQQIVVKALQSIAQTQRNMMRKAAEDQEARGPAPADVPLNKRSKSSNDDTFVNTSDDRKGRTMKTRSSRSKPAATSPPVASTASTKKAPDTATDTVGSSTDSDVHANFIAHAKKAVENEQSQYMELAKYSPMDFVKKSWEELAALSAQSLPSHIEGSDGQGNTNYDENFQALALDHTDALLYAMMQTPYTLSSDYQDILTLGLESEDMLGGDLKNAAISDAKQTQETALEQHTDVTIFNFAVPDAAATTLTNGVGANDTEKDSNASWWLNSDVLTVKLKNQLKTKFKYL